MQAVAFFPEEREVRIIQEPDPKITRPEQVEVKMLEVGVCGTDREIAGSGRADLPAGSSHLVLGHESLGEVVRTGPAATTLRRGDLVVGMVRRPCPHSRCRACRSGRPDFCYTGDYQERGIRGLHGYMAERVLEEQQWLVPVPRELRDVAVLIEPLSIAEKALRQVDHVQQRLPWTCQHRPGEGAAHCHRAVVLGGGALGLLCAMALVTRGYTTYVYSRSPEDHTKARLTRAFGAEYVSSSSVSTGELEERVGGIDLVCEAAGAGKAAFDMLAHLGTNGVFVFTGIPGYADSMVIDSQGLMRDLVHKNQIVFGTVNAGRDACEAAVRDLATFRQRWPEAVRGLVTGRHPVESFKDLLAGNGSGIKDVIAF